MGGIGDGDGVVVMIGSNAGCEVGKNIAPCDVIGEDG
jgi:hypothetical protein